MSRRRSPTCVSATTGRSPPELLDAGPTWEDRPAERRDIVHETGRVRIYLTQQQAGEEQRRTVERAARREYQVLQGITHRGIAQAVQIRDHQGSPAILFHHDPTDLRLDSYLAVHGGPADPRGPAGPGAAARRGRPVRPQPLALPPGARGAFGLRVGRQGRLRPCAPGDRLAGRGARLRADGEPVARASRRSAARSIGDAADVYLAPEFGSPYPDPVDLDVFGLGAVAYLILTGRPPASSRSALDRPAGSRRRAAPVRRRRHDHRRTRRAGVRRHPQRLR